MLKSSTAIAFLSISIHTSKSLCLIYFNTMFSGPLKFMDRTMISLLIITFINIKWLSLPYLMHFALNVTLSMFHFVFFFLSFPFSWYICVLGSVELVEDGIMSFRDGWNRVLCLLFAPVPSLWQYKHGFGGVRQVKKLLKLTCLLWFPALGRTENSQS